MMAEKIFAPVSFEIAPDTPATPTGRAGEPISAATGIDRAMIAVMNEIGAVGKTERNQQQGFAYRGIAQIYDAAHYAMAKHGVYMLPEVLECTQHERATAKGGVMFLTLMKVKYRFVAADGSARESVVYGEAMDSADKSTNKAMAAAHKYCITQSFCLPYSEMTDGDAETPEPIQPRAPVARMKETQPTAAKNAAERDANIAKPPTMQEWAAGFIDRIKAAESQEALAVLFNGASKGLAAIRKASPGLYTSIMAADDVRRGELRFPPDPMSGFDDKLPDFS